MNVHLDRRPRPTTPAPAEPITSVPFLDLRAGNDEVRDDLDRCWQTAVDQSGFVGGDAVSVFEMAFARYCGQPHAVGVANGTDALTLILQGLGVGAGDEVIVPTNTFIATPEAVSNVGATPVFIDVDPATLLMQPDRVRGAITDRTAAVMAVHLYGQMVDMVGLAEVCREARLHLIEDAAQAHGARRDGHVAGSLGIAAAFSFYPGKNLGALGDAGAIVTADRELAAVIRSLANHGRSETSASEHLRIGSNSRLDSLQASLLTVKLDRLDDWNEQRRSVHRWYRELLPAGATPVSVAGSSEPVHHLEVVQVDHRDDVRVRLAEAGIATGIHYPVPCHRLAAFSDSEPRDPNDDRQTPHLAVSEAAAGRILSLPMYPQMGRDAVVAVCDALGRALTA